MDTLTDHKNSRKYLYEYDMYDRATSCKVYSIATGAYLEGSRLGYDKHGRTKWESSYHSEIPATVTNVYTYDDNSNLTNISTSRGDIETGYVYDGFYRLSSESLYRYIGMGGSYSSPTLTRSYSYVLKNGYTTNLIEKLSYSGLSSREFTYSYDSYGNISSAGYNGNTSTYEYDDLGQLTRENNQELGKTWVYEYDSRGNILSRKTYAYTTGELGAVLDTDIYTYSGDRLMSYDGSMNFQYDAIGNPTLYFNSRSSGDIYTFTWEEGRQLASGDRSGTSFSYTYDMNGIRTSKTVGETTHNYFTSGGKLQAMTITVGGTLTATMYFYYNASGIPVALKYNNVVYYYLTNLQGDVVGIVNANGGIVVTYSYDAWGRPLSSTCAGNYDQPLMENNPLRYRGYIYDNETGFYYLQSRYYDPDVGRFLNADGYVSTGTGILGYNMYAYCNNNPVNYIDPTGNLTVPALIVMIATAIVFATLVLSPVIELCSTIDDMDISDELYTSDSLNGDGVFEERVVWYDVEGGSSLESVGYISASTGLIKGEYDYEYFDADFGFAKASTQLSTNVFEGVGASFMLEALHGSAYFVIPVFDHEIKVGVSGSLGSFGGKAVFGQKTEIGFAYGMGGSINIEFS